MLLGHNEVAETGVFGGIKNFAIPGEKRNQFVKVDHFAGVAVFTFVGHNHQF